MFRDEVIQIAVSLGFSSLDVELLASSDEPVYTTRYTRTESDGERILVVGFDTCTISKTPSQSQHFEPAPIALSYAKTTEAEIRAYLDRATCLIKPRVPASATGHQVKP